MKVLKYKTDDDRRFFGSRTLRCAEGSLSQDDKRAMWIPDLARLKRCPVTRLEDQAFFPSQVRKHGPGAPRFIAESGDADGLSRLLPGDLRGQEFGE
jgi:hypothetical protein